MDGTIQAYVLDMAADTKKEPLRVKQYDTNSRQARITLKMGGEPWTIPFGCQIHINVRKTDGKLADATCTREDEHTVLAPITEQMTAVTGTQLGELYFLGSDGDIKSQTFPVVVYEAVMDQARIESSDDFQALKDALRDVKTSTEAADNAAQYATEQGNSARDGAQRANDAADSIQVAVDAAAAAKASETNAKTSETAAAQTQQEVTDYVEAQKAAFVGYSQRESDSKYANALTATTTGEGGVTVEDAWTAPVLGLDVAGKSEQVVTTGTNLFGGLALVEKLKAEANATVDGANRTVMFSAANINGKIIYSNFEAGKEYTIILYGRNTNSENNGTNIRVKYANGVFSSLMFTMSRSDSYCVYHTSPQLDVVNFSGTWASQDTILYYDKCGIFEGNIDLSAFEPYTGCAPSPSPEYPQDIISVGTVSTGAQLFDASTIKSTALNGVTFTNNGDGSITVKGTATAQTSTNFVKVNLEPGQYRISGGKAEIKIIARVQDDETINYYSNNKFDVTRSNNVNIYMQIDSGKTVDATVWPMLNAGDTALSWEPYTGGKPSPSVEYPAELELVLTNKNLLPLKNIDTVRYGVTFKLQNDGSIKANGTVTGTGTCTLAELRLMPGKYTYSGLSGQPDNSIVMQLFEIDAPGGTVVGTSLAIIGTTTGSKVITIERPMWVRARTAIFDGAIINVVFYPMLNAGDTPLPWEPYQSTSATITLTEPLRGIGEYRDRIMRKDGEWGIERYWRSIMLDGNIPYREYNQLNVSKEVRANEGIIKTKPIKGLFNNFNPCDRTWDRDEIGIGAFNSGIEAFGVISLRIPVDAVPVEYMAAHPAEAIYQPYDFPTWEPLPAATQQALNALTTYAGTTHLTITAGGLTPDVTLEYVQDTQKAIEQHDTANRQYTDNQIAAIVAALPTATQAAIVDNQTTKLLQEV